MVRVPLAEGRWNPLAEGRWNRTYVRASSPRPGRLRRGGREGHVRKTGTVKGGKGRGSRSRRGGGHPYGSQDTRPAPSIHRPPPSRPALDRRGAGRTLHRRLHAVQHAVRHVHGPLQTAVQNAARAADRTRREHTRQLPGAAREHATANLRRVLGPPCVPPRPRAAGGVCRGHGRDSHERRPPRREAESDQDASGQPALGTDAAFRPTQALLDDLRHDGVVAGDLRRRPRDWNRNERHAPFRRKLARLQLHVVLQEEGEAAHRLKPSQVAHRAPMPRLHAVCALVEQAAAGVAVRRQVLRAHHRLAAIRALQRRGSGRHRKCAWSRTAAPPRQNSANVPGQEPLRRRGKVPPTLRYP